MLGRSASITVATLLATGSVLVQDVVAQEDGSSAVWHNRYHALLALATYNDGDRMEQCRETFTEASMRENFPSEPLHTIS